jgi:1-deoxy-D-xylulose-5-phosphate synthase
VFDIAYLRALPRLVVIAPKDPLELRAMLQWAVDQDVPVAIRYPRGGIVCGEPLGKPAKIALGKAEPLRQGKDVALVALGSMVYPALAIAGRLAQQHIESSVVNARFVRPMDQEMIRQAVQAGAIVTLEEAQVAGGFGSAVSETLDALGLSKISHLRIGIPDGFVEHGKRSELLALCRLDYESLTQRIAHWLETTKASSELPAGDLRLLTHPSTSG